VTLRYLHGRVDHRCITLGIWPPNNTYQFSRELHNNTLKVTVTPVPAKSIQIRQE